MVLSVFSNFAPHGAHFTFGDGDNDSNDASSDRRIGNRSYASKMQAKSLLNQNLMNPSAKLAMPVVPVRRLESSRSVRSSQSYQRVFNPNTVAESDNNSDSQGKSEDDPEFSDSLSPAARAASAKKFAPKPPSIARPSTSSTQSSIAAPFSRSASSTFRPTTSESSQPFLPASTGIRPSTSSSTFRQSASLNFKDHQGQSIHEARITPAGFLASHFSSAPAADDHFAFDSYHQVTISATALAEFLSCGMAESAPSHSTQDSSLDEFDKKVLNLSSRLSIKPKLG
jgi:hypothetical protein